jgi:hypothetical protein
MATKQTYQEAYSTQPTPGQMRIVKEMRGEVMVGFRVQFARYNRASGDCSWGNVGRRSYTLDFARKQRDYFQDLYCSVRVATTYEEIV